MSIIISRDIILTDDSLDDPNAGHIGIQTVIARNNLSADYSDGNKAIANLANVATNLFWRSSSLADQYITIAAGLNEGVDYVAFANHNFASGGISYQVEGSNDGVTWTPISDTIIPENDSPHVQIFPLAIYPSYRIHLTPSLVVPRIAVLYLGKMFVLQRKIYVGHTPITMGRDTSFVTNRSESGQFLGRVIRKQSLGTTVDLKNLTEDWYRAYFEDFVIAARTRPFFWAWRPIDYPQEVGYVWTTDDIIPKNQRNNGMMSVSMKIVGIGSFVAISGAGTDFDTSVDV